MSNTPLGGKDVSEAIHKAVHLALADVGHHGVAAKTAQSWHTIGIIMTEEAKAEAVAKSIIEHANVDAHPAIVRIDPKHIIVGFVSPDVLQRQG